MVDPGHPDISLVRQCQLLGLPRATYYYQPRPESEENLKLMRLIDEQYTRTPFYGTRRLAVWLGSKGYSVDRKRMRRLMQMMGLEAIYPKPRLSVAAPDHKVYPYLLRGVTPKGPDHIWSTDITYIRMNRGFLYLVAVLDWYSRYVLAWELSNSLEATFCIVALRKALSRSAGPEIFNSDQGAQFTSNDFTDVLLQHGVKISMDGRGRALDNIFVERLWRSVKYEEVHLKDYQTGLDAYRGLDNYFNFYNNERPHQSLGYQTPAAVYFGCGTPVPGDQVDICPVECCG